MTVLENVTLRMQHRASGAAGALVKFLKSKDDRMRFRAVQYLLDRVLRWREATILEDVLSEAEQRLAGEEEAPPPG